jgi:hypothetical protein
MVEIILLQMQGEIILDGQHGYKLGLAGKLSIPAQKIVLVEIGIGLDLRKPQDMLL